MKTSEFAKLGLTKWDYVRNVVSTKLNLAQMQMEGTATKKNLKLFDKFMKEAIHYLYKERVLAFKPRVKYVYEYHYEQNEETMLKEKVADIVLKAKNKKAEEFVMEVIK